MRALAIALACACAAAAAEAPPGPADFGALRGALDNALWNGRINALYDLGELGPAGLDLLAYADDDADWQVRLTAVHFLGKLGSAAAPELAGVAGREPCPYVRLSALLFLRRLGPAGEPYYRAALTPEDERALAELPARYGVERMGKPLVIDAPGGEMTSEFFNGGADLRVCASSERAGRLHVHRDGGAQEAPDEIVKTPDVPVRSSSGPAPAAAAAAAPPAPETPAQRRRDAEIDAVLAPGTPETLPPGPAGFAARETASAGPRFEAPARRALAAAAVRAVSSGTPESLPPGLPAPVRPETERGRAVIVADAGTGRPELDPVPVLIAQLRSPEPRARARAADELGKRGSAAAPAVPALRRLLASDPDRRARASAALALGGAGAGVKGVAAELRRALRDKDEDVRFSAAIALERARKRR